MRCYGASDVGKIRKVNEDSFYIQTYDSNHALAIVADGMGGHKGGKKASALAVKVISEYFEALMPALLGYNGRQLKHSLLKSCKKANEAIFSEASLSDELSGMGTTIVACFLHGTKLYVLNAGDSRLYIINDEIKQITKDHSLVGELMSLGVISANQALNHPQKNVITKALGADENIDADIYSLKLSENDYILLCTDGLTNMVDDEKIAQIIKTEPDIDSAAKKLINEAKESGGNDNITAVIIKPVCGGEE
ncbi:MAG: Stp1/IreP family PP2C-type Ser/Thr phosphatase [Ruminococcaceae bacterium]|nr:Stp1/IreP family PP2C-type Ser/Thr phosphatase [Oscillospiraceae bacterium]